MTMSKSASTSNLTAYERWELPLVNDPAKQVPVTAEALENIQKQAYNEGFALGQKDGYEKTKHELDSKIASFSSIIEMLTEPLNELDDEIIEQLAQLSMSVAKQVIRRELHAEQGEIVGIVREAMSALPASTRKITLNIHPEDAELIRTSFSLGEEEESDELRWRVIEDPMISRGGCKITSKNSSIDATVEGRLNRLISTLLGGERETDE